MARELGHDDLAAAVAAGLFLSAGGSGRAASARHRRIGELALGYGRLRLHDMVDLAGDEQIITATGVGAPGFSKAVIEPRDSVDAARTLVDLLPVRPTCVIPGHVPGLYAWLVAAVLGLKLVDMAGNGRGHPTVKMGSMGLASRPDLQIVQVGVGGSDATGERLTVTARGNIMRTSDLMHHAATVYGGLVMAARGPVTADFARAHGAAGAITFQLDLGRAMLAAPAGEARVRATAEFLDGRLLAVGEVRENTVAFDHGFDVGHLTVAGAGGAVRLGVYNEYMTAEVDGLRCATFPDQIGTLDPDTGDTLAVADLAVGARCAVIVASKRRFPVGAGALDPAVYPEVEAAMGTELQRYALDPEA